MAILANNIFNGNLEYSGIVILIFTIISYIINQNSYCEGNNALCKNPAIISNDMIPNENIAGRSVDGIVQNIKCEPLSSADVSTYSYTTNKGIALFSALFTFVLIFILVSSQNLNIFKNIIFNNIKTSQQSLFEESIFICILLSLVIGITNYVKKGYEVESIWFLIFIYSIVSMMTVGFYKKTSGKEHLDMQGEFIIVLLIAILVITIPNYKYVNELKLGHAFVSSGAWVSVIIESLVAFLVGIALIDNYSDLLKTPFLFIIYIIIFITMVAQIIYFLKHIYNCVWKTYTCEPNIEINKKKDMTQININCSAKLDVSNSMIVFAILAVLFLVLPSEWVLDYITMFLSNSLDALSTLFD
jgi:hypothetical protein